MRYSPEELLAFVEVAHLGSFTAAARKLKKSQSTISVSIGNLEADIGVRLFERQPRQTVITAAGQRVLKHVEEIMAASHKLDELSIRLLDGVEQHVSIVFSDACQADVAPALAAFGARFPVTALACGVAEEADGIRRVQAGEATMAILPARADYPLDIAVARMPEQALMGIYIASSHEIASRRVDTVEQLRPVREISLLPPSSTNARPGGPGWSAPSYLTLLEMVRGGLGWAELPCKMVERYGGGCLTRLPVAGWPRRLDMHVVWSREHMPGRAGFWLIDALASAL